MARREFTRNQKEQIVERSKRNGVICCEGCGLVLAGKAHEIDHIIPEALRPEADKQRKLTIAEGQLLGRDCCHRGEDGKTGKDVTQIAKGKRQNAKHIRIVAPPKMQGAAFARSPKAASRQPKPSLPARPMFSALWKPTNNSDIMEGDHE